MTFSDPYTFSTQAFARFDIHPFESAHTLDSNPLPLEQKTKLHLNTFYV